MLGVKSLTNVGLVMQAMGTILLTIQLWGSAWGFDTSFGLIDRHGRWRYFVRLGLLIYIFSYIPLLVAVQWSLN